jgi:hypothetical protein
LGFLFSFAIVDLLVVHFPFAMLDSILIDRLCLVTGPNLNLVRKVKKLFQHVVDIIERVPSFIPDYNNVLSQLLSVFEYRVRMGKKIYAGMSGTSDTVCKSGSHCAYTLLFHVMPTPGGPWSWFDKLQLQNPYTGSS